MATTIAQRRNFLRSVYQHGDTQYDRRAYLDGLAAEIAKRGLSGKSLVGSASDRISVQYALIPGVQPADAEALIDWAYEYIGETDIEAALALIPRHGITRLQVSFGGLR